MLKTGLRTFLMPKCIIHDVKGVLSMLGSTLHMYQSVFSFIAQSKTLENSSPHPKSLPPAQVLVPHMPPLPQYSSRCFTEEYHSCTHSDHLESETPISSST